MQWFDVSCIGHSGKPRHAPSCHKKQAAAREKTHITPVVTARGVIVLVVTPFVTHRHPIPSAVGELGDKSWVKAGWVLTVIPGGKNVEQAAVEHRSVGAGTLTALCFTQVIPEGGKGGGGGGRGGDPVDFGGIVRVLHRSEKVPRDSPAIDGCSAFLIRQSCRKRVLANVDTALKSSSFVGSRRSPRYAPP